MRIGQLHMDAQDKTRFEILGKSSVKYHLKANHEVEAKRWVWALNNAIQYCKDEAKALAKSHDRNAELLRQAKVAELGRKQTREMDPATGMAAAQTSLQVGRDAHEEEDGTASTYEPSAAGDDIASITSKHKTTALESDLDDDDDFPDDASSIAEQPVSKDAFLIAAHSARMQLELLSQIATSLNHEQTKDPNATISQPAIAQALASYQAAVANLNGLVGDLGRIARDREAYWQHRLEQEVNVRRLWEDNVTKIVQQSEELETRIGESEEKRKRTKRALRDALENTKTSDEFNNQSAVLSPGLETATSSQFPGFNRLRAPSTSGRRKSTYAEMADIIASEDEEEDDEEFFDAVGAGEVEVVEDLPPVNVNSLPQVVPAGEALEHKTIQTHSGDLQSSYRGYEDPVRKKLKMDADNRPKISLWVSASEARGAICLRRSGHPQIHDWKGHDQDDIASVFQRTYVTPKQSGGRHGIH